MAAIKKNSEPLDNLSSKEIEDIVRSNEMLDQENEKLIKEEEKAQLKEDNPKVSFTSAKANKSSHQALA